MAERNDVDPKETSVTIQDVDRGSMRYVKTERDDPSWAAQEGPLLIPASNLDLISGMRSKGTSMDIFVRGVGVGLIHTENLLINKLRIARETGDLEAETDEDPKKSDIGRVVESYFNLPNEYSSIITLTGSVTNSEMRTGENRNTRLSNAPADPEVDNEKASKQRIKAQISTSA